MKSKKKVLMLAHAYFPEDPRIRKEALSLVRNEFGVYVICLRDKDEPRTEFYNGINIFRLPVKRHRGRGFFAYLYEYLTFCILSFFRTSAIFFKEKIDIVQVHTLPDFLIFSTILAKIFGAKVILDMHELTPEFYASRYKKDENSIAIRTIQFIEKISTKFANHIITVNHTLKDVLVEKGIAPEKISVVLNLPEKRFFSKRSSDKIAKGKKTFKIIYQGLLSDIYDLDTLLKAMGRIREKIDNVSLDIYGKGNKLVELTKLSKSLDVDDIVSFKGYIEPAKMPKVIFQYDLGVVTLADWKYTDLALPTKLFEFLSMGIRTVVSDRKTVRRYLNEHETIFYTPEDPQSLADCIIKSYKLLKGERGDLKICKKNIKHLFWEEREGEYIVPVRKYCKY